MKHRIAITVLLALAIMGFQNTTIDRLEQLPLSQPTPVELFMDRVSEIESGGNHTVVNQYGMLGKYQFSMPAIRAVGIRVSRAEFLRNAELQDTAMVRLMKLHEQILESYIERYDGKTVKGVRITRAGIIAGAHFAGAQGVKNFFITNTHTGTIDGNGTTLRYYMSKFSDFHLPQITL